MKKKIFLLVTTMGSSVLATGMLTYRDAKCKMNNWDSNWDHRQPESLVKPDTSVDKIEEKNSIAKRTIYLVRHGQYQLDQKQDEDKKLTTLGRKQAECTGKRLANIGVRFSNFTASTMTRAKETGEIIFEHLKDTPTHSIDGIEKLEFEKSDMLREGYPIQAVPFHRFKPDIYEFADGCRIEAAFRKFLSRADYSQTEDSHEIIVCHANVIRYLICRVMQHPPEGWLRMSLANGSITEIVLSPNGNVSVVGIGDKSHIPVEMVSYT